MLVDHGAEVGARMQARVGEAQRQRLLARAREGRRDGTGRSLAGVGWRLRQAAGFGLVRTGLWLLDGGRA
jgi:hypothetical protein